MTLAALPALAASMLVGSPVLVLAALSLFAAAPMAMSAALLGSAVGPRI